MGCDSEGTLAGIVLKRRAASNLGWKKLREEIVSCTRCPRLVKYRREVAHRKKRQFMNCRYWGAPLVGFGDRQGELLVVGLAPAAHGGNRTGRMFTGDGSADFLMRALHTAGFANQSTSDHDRDGLQMMNSFMTAVVRCAPPQNKPLASELANCSIFLDKELALLSHVRVVLALGQVAFKGYLDHLKRRGLHVARLEFKHGQKYSLPPGLPVLVASYHPSRQNTQTGRLTSRMMDAALRVVKTSLAEST
jgi:uracil-DNA glycosylase family 4